jgi:hypothetical protein
MLTIKVHKAAPTIEPVPDVQLTFADVIETKGLSLEQCGRLFEEDANALMVALSHLPGGTLHRLLIKLLQDKACSLVIKW